MRHRFPTDLDISILHINCINPKCKSPIFFSWKKNPTQVTCQKCNTMMEILQRKGKFLIATSVIGGDGNIIIKCRECGYVFIPEDVKEEQICKCPKCERKYYIHKANPHVFVKQIPKVKV